MSDLITLARPYAKAAFECAKSEQKLSQWLNALTVASALVVDSKVEQLISQPSVQEQTVVDMLSDREAGEGYVNFIRILFENNRLKLLPEIAQLYAYYQEQDSQSITVNVVSAASMSEQQKVELVSSLTERLGKKVMLNTQVDSSLIGGARIQYGDVVIDGTLKGKLKQLKSSLIH